MNNKPTILVFIDWYKPAYKAGGPITSCVNFIELLKSEFNFKVFTSCFDYLETQPLNGIEINQWHKMDGIEVYYADRKHQKRSFIKTLIRETKHEFLWINGIFSPKFSIAPLMFRNKSTPCLVSARGMLGKNVLQFKSKKKFAFLRFAKLMKWHKGVRFHATNEVEKKDIQSIFPGNEIVVALNVPSIPTNEKSTTKKEAGELKVLQVARIAKEKNTFFAINALQDLKGKVQLDIVGSVYDKDYAEQCFKAAESLKDNIQVNFLGSKSPFELSDLYRNYHLFFLPTLGENYGHAIAESLSYALPNLVSDQTIWKGLKEQKAGFDLPLKIEVFKETLQRFIEMEEEEFVDWKNGAKTYFKKKVNWSEILDQNKKLFQFD